MNLYRLAKWCLCLLISASPSYGIHAAQEQEQSKGYPFSGSKTLKQIKNDLNKINIKTLSEKELEKMSPEEVKCMMMLKAIKVVSRKNKKDAAKLISAWEVIPKIEDYNMNLPNEKDFLMHFHNVLIKAFFEIDKETHGSFEVNSADLSVYKKFIGKNQKDFEDFKELLNGSDFEENKWKNTSDAKNLYERNAAAVEASLEVADELLKIQPKEYSKYKLGTIAIAIFTAGTFVGMVYNEIYRTREEAKKDSQKDRHEEDDEDEDEVVTTKRKPKKTS